MVSEEKVKTWKLGTLTVALASTRLLRIVEVLHVLEEKNIIVLLVYTSGAIELQGVVLAVVDNLREGDGGRHCVSRCHRVCDRLRLGVQLSL